MMRRLILFAASLLIALPVWAGVEDNVVQLVMADTEVAVGVPISATISNTYHTAGYLVVKTENETSAASLTVTVLNSTALGDFLVCTLTAITSNTTEVALLGSTVAAADGVTDACDWPMSDVVKFTFTVTGAGSDFDVSATMHWVGN